MKLAQYLEKLEQITEDCSALRVYTEAKIAIPKLVKMVRALSNFYDMETENSCDCRRNNQGIRDAALEECERILNE